MHRAENAGGFEAALGECQSDYLGNRIEHRDRLKSLQAAITAMFSDMEAGFASRPSLEFSQEIKFQVSRFLARFDAIFTLNQDLLLERHYLEGNINAATPRKWNGWRSPGMRALSDPGITGCRKVRWTPCQPSDFRTESNIQPYFKLHGSWNWWSADGEQMVILGGNKLSTISHHPILDWYQKQFTSYLSQPNTRLMVIGYGFGDQHINDTIYHAWRRTNSLAMFIIHPRGRGVLNKSRPNNIRVPDPLEEVPDVGWSMRLLSSTFGGDEAEHRKIMRFFDG